MNAFAAALSAVDLMISADHPTNAPAVAPDFADLMKNYMTAVDRLMKIAAADLLALDRMRTLAAAAQKIAAA